MKAIVVISLCLLSFSCKNDFAGVHPYTPPVHRQDGLRVGTLEEVKIDTRRITEALDRIDRGKYNEIHSLVIFKDNKLVLEEYFPGHEYKWDAPGHHDVWTDWDSDMPHYAHSVSKSITSMCVGIAVDKGFISDIHQSIFDYLPEYQDHKTPENEKITIEHLLTGTSGLQWAEWNAPLSSMENDQIAIWFHEKGPVDFVLSRPLVAVPGTRFTYSGGNIELLGVIIENASGISFEKFSAEYLFKPLGMDQAEWAIIYQTGEVHAAAGLRVTPREMVKLGALMLNGGVWNGEEILPETWIEKCMYPFPECTGIKIPGEDLGKAGYAYAWWTKEIKYKGQDISWYSANGWGGQKIIVLPELNAVVVFTGATYNARVKEYEIFEDYILPALAD